ncbi:MAG: hypothetical protein EON54_20380 [Alcaligenaceae bacterium]|nr:MAG: hypothetical protein EON54_20380 [Alcaligenaceae bacterium]
MKRFKVFSAAFIVAVMFMVGAGVANAQPSSPLMSGGDGKPSLLVPDVSFCESTQDAATLGACAAGLTNEFRNSVGMVPHPGYSYVSKFGITFIPPCFYSEAAALYCDNNVRLGQKTLEDMFKLKMNPQAYATYLLGHEAAHHSQTVVGGADLVWIFATPSVKPFELQAVCVGGMNLKYHVEQGRFTMADAQGVAAILASALWTWTHGSGAEQSAAFWTGYNATSVNGCIGGKFASSPLV